MFEPIIIELEGVPAGKGRPRFGQGRTYTPAKTRSYEEALGYAARAVMGARMPLEGALAVTVRAGMPIPSSWSRAKRERALTGLLRPTVKPDGDNLLKIALDPLNGVVFYDDAQAVDSTVSKVYAAEPLPAHRSEGGMTAIPSGSTAVMARRVEPPDSLEFFPTPPWATRALFVHVLPSIGARVGPDRWPSAWDPACGEGHMSSVMEEFCAPVISTDVFDYSARLGKHPAGWFRVQDFLDPAAETPVVDWIITNPPFRTAIDFALLGLERAQEGVALLVRTQWIESVGRYDRLFKDRPPTLFAPFVERVPMVKGRWDPAASTATSYAWFVWLKDAETPWRTLLIPPGCRKTLSKPDDLRLAAASRETSLFASSEGVTGPVSCNPERDRWSR